MPCLPFLACLQVQSHSANAGPPPFRAPNVVVVVLDDVGTEELDVYGIPAAWGESHARTPVLDHLRARGVLFEHVWAAPSCSPTRAMILTGRHGFRTGMMNIAETSGPCPPGAVFRGANSCCPANDPLCSQPENQPVPPLHQNGYSLPLAEVTLAEALRDATFPGPTDFARGAFGKWHVAGRPDDPCHAIEQGFEVFQGHLYNNEGGGRHHYDWVRFDARATPQGCTQTSANLVGAWDAEITALDARDWIDARRADPSGRPFFAWVAFNPPHRPFQVPPQSLVSPETWSLLQERGLAVEGLETSGVRSCQPGTVQEFDSRDARLVYRAAIEAVDALIGRVVLESAESPDVLQDTLVVVIGDNGTPDHVLSATQVPDELGVQSPPFPPNHGKFQVYELGLRVPLIVTGLGAQPGGTCRSLVSAVDVWSTVLDVCAADAGTLVPSGEIDSHSFAERLVRPVGPVSSPDRSEIYAEYAARNGMTYSQSAQAWSPVAPGGTVKYQRAILDRKGYKYIRRVIALDPGCTTTSNLCTPLPEEEMYRVRYGSLPFDPFESLGVCGDPEAVAEQARLRQILVTRYSGD